VLIDKSALCGFDFECALLKVAILYNPTPRREGVDLGTDADIGVVGSHSKLASTFVMTERRLNIMRLVAMEFVARTIGEKTDGIFICGKWVRADPIEVNPTENSTTK
jgi:hypothetical protein